MSFVICRETTCFGNNIAVIVITLCFEFLIGCKCKLSGSGRSRHSAKQNNDGTETEAESEWNNDITNGNGRVLSQKVTVCPIDLMRDNPMFSMSSTRSTVGAGTMDPVLTKLRR